MTTTQTSFAGGVTFLSSTLDDATATQLGLKQYLHGTTYNGGNAPTVTCSLAGFSVLRAVFVPYQCQDGSWRLRLNLNGTFTSATFTTATVTINGITFKSVANFFQPCAVMFVGATSVGRTYANNGGSGITCDTSSITATAIGLSGDCELNAKPTWAY